MNDYDEYCSRVDDELRAVEERWPLSRCFAVLAVIAGILWAVAIWIAYELFYIG